VTVPPAKSTSHLDDLAVEQLDPIVFAEHARLGHPVVFVHGEAASGERHAHTIPECRRRVRWRRASHRLLRDGAGSRER
jgi:hypothetical protein